MTACSRAKTRCREADFGNLIALPLQHEPRQQGNSVFIDDQLKPYPDDQQWAYLSSVARIDPGTR